MGERERRVAALSWTQRIWRRWRLLCGSYTWADGKIELDFEEPAGIDPWGDDQATQERKLDLYDLKNARRVRQNAAIYVAAAALLLGLHIEMPTWQLVAMVAFVFFGFRNMVA